MEIGIHNALNAFFSSHHVSLKYAQFVALPVSLSWSIFPLSVMPPFSHLQLVTDGKVHSQTLDIADEVRLTFVLFELFHFVVSM